jgi:hypothetical protein
VGTSANLTDEMCDLRGVPSKDRFVGDLNPDLLALH